MSDINWHDFEKETSAEDSETRYQIGMCFLLGIGVARSDDRAHAYFELAEKQDHAGAQNILGSVYI